MSDVGLIVNGPRRHGARWTRQEDLAALHLKLKGVKRDAPEVQDLANRIERSADAVWVRVQHYRHLDRRDPSGGLSHVIEQQRRIWQKYEADPSKVMAEANIAFDLVYMGI